MAALPASTAGISKDKEEIRVDRDVSSSHGVAHPRIDVGSKEDNAADTTKCEVELSSKLASENAQRASKSDVQMPAAQKQA